MRYLFFDIECCNGYDICEFGYVITDEEFNIQEKKVITINPESPFNLTGRAHKKGIHLYFPQSVYYESNTFTHFYGEIKNLIEYPDQLIVGHGISNDAVFLRTACERYRLGPINFRFADSQRMYAEYANIHEYVSLENAGNLLSIEKPEYLHKSDDDSELTMNLVKRMCNELDCPLADLIELCDSCSGKSENFEIGYDSADKKLQEKYERAKNGISNEIKGQNFKMFLHFLKGVEPKESVVNSPLNGKSVCVSSNYEYHHFREMLSLVQLLSNHHAEYRLIAPRCQIFVTFDAKDKNGNDKFCARLKRVKEAIEKGRKIKIMSFSKLLEILNVSEEDLTAMPFPERRAFYNELDTKSKNKVHNFEDKSVRKPTLGDLYSDLFEKLKENLKE